MIFLALALTALVSAFFGLAPAVLSCRKAARCDRVWTFGLWLGVWLFAACAYHRPGLTVGFDTFRLLALTALCGWAGLVTAGLRCFGKKGLRAVVPLLAVTALGAEAFIGNIAYFNTHSYEPFQLVDYLDPNINVGRGVGTISLDSDRTYLRFLNIDQPIYNLRFDGLVNDDTDLLHTDSMVTFTLDASDEANGAPIRFGSWEVGLQSPRSHVISLDLTGKVGTLIMQAQPYHTAHQDFPVALTFSGITANAPRAMDFSVLRCAFVFLVLLALYALRPRSGLWTRRWLAGNVCDRAAAAALGLILAAFVVVIPFWEPSNSGLATKDYNTAFWDGESSVSFVSQQYGALAHSLLQGRLDLEADPPEALLAMENPYDVAARSEAQIEGALWDHAFYNGRFYVYFGVVPCLLFQLPFEALTGIQNLAYAPCMVILGLVLLVSCFGIVGQAVRRWFPQTSAAAYLLAVAAVVSGSQLYYLLLRPYIYEYAILCGSALLLLGLWLWLSAAATPMEKRGTILVKLVFGSLCVALVAGCRPQMELFAFLAVPIFWQRYIAGKRLRSRAGAGEAVAFLLPVVVIAAGLMWYNAARFGSPFDFGANYNMTGNDMTKRGFNVVRIGPAVFTSLFELPSWQGIFPFLRETDVQTNAIIRTISEKFTGGILAATPYLWVLALLLLPAFRRCLQRRRSAACLVWTGLAAMVIITVVDCQMAGVLYRYLMDYSPVLLLAAALCWFCAENALTRRTASGDATAAAALPALRIAMAAAAACTAVYRFCTLFTMEPWLQGMNPSLYYTVSRLVQFWM